MSKRRKKRPPSGALSEANPYILAIPFLAVTLLILAGALFPGRLTWGVSFMSLFDRNAALLACILALLASLPPVAGGLANILSPFAKRLTRFVDSINKPVIVVVLSVVATLVLFYWRSRSFVYGDGYILISDASSGEKLTLAEGHYLKILTVYLNHYGYDLFNSFGTWSADEVVGLINAVGGMLGLWAVWRICRQLSSDTATRTFLFLGSFSSASVVLFFGYIENYTWALSLALWTLSFSIGFVRRQNGAAILVVTAVLAALFHLINLAMVMIALVSLKLETRSDGNYVLGVRLRHINLGLVAASFLAVALSRILNLKFFVPILPVDGNPYSVFAIEHIIDVFNQIGLAAPLGAAMVILTLSYLSHERRSDSAESGLLGTTALVLFLSAVWIDPELGAPRDWDLLSFYGLPITFWGLYRFSRYFPEGRVARRWLVAAGVVGAITLVPNLYEKNHPDLAVAHLDALLNVDPHYQATYYEAGRCEPWAVALQKGYGDMRRAIKYLERRIATKPDSHIAFFNLADSYYYLGILDSAYMYIRRGLYLKEDEAQKLVNASAIAKDMGNYGDAIMWAQKAVQIEPASASAQTQLGVSLTWAKRPGEALVHFRRAYNLAPQAYDHIVNMGMAHALTGSADSAYQYYESALRLSPDDRRADIYFCLVSLGIDLGRLDEASRYLNMMRRIDPASPDILQLESRLREAVKR